MATRNIRCRGSIVEPLQEEEEEEEDDDMTQPPTQPYTEEHEEDDIFANLSGILDAHGNPTSLQVLTPQALWFDNHSVVQVITDGIQAYYDGPYTCWKKSSDLAKDQWWRFFRDKFKWSPQHSSTVKIEFKKKAGLCLKDMVNKACKVPDHKTIFWLSADMRQSLKTVRSTPEFKKRSRQYLHNRMGGPNAGTKHSQGSISTMQIAKKMMKETGVLPTASELFLKTHQRPDKSFCDPRAEKLNMDFEDLVAGTNTNNDISISAKNDLFVKASGGFTPQGTIYGIGNSASLFFKRPSGSMKFLNQAAATPSIVSQLEQRLKATTEELDATKKQLVEQKEKSDGHANDLLEQKNLIEGLYGALNSLSQEMRRYAPSQFSDQITPTDP